MSTQEVEMVDIHEWDAEESPDKREEEKSKIKKLLDRSVVANEGNPGMVKRLLKSGVTDPQKYKCHASFISYSIDQVPSKPGETSYKDKSEWNDRAANWSPLLLTGREESGSIEENKMDRLLGKDRKTICLDVEDICTNDMMPFERELRRKDAGAYNDHMRDIHGVKTEV